MYKKFVSKTLIALAASGAFSYAVASPDAPANAVAQNTAASDDATLKIFEEWVKDLQKALPTMYKFSLEDYKNEGNLSTGVIRAEIKDFTDDRFYRDPVVLASETTATIEHGLTLSKHGIGAGKIQFTTGFSKDTHEEILEVLGSGPFLKADGIVTLTGDIHVDLQNPAPFEKDIDNEVLISIPSYTGEFHTYNTRTTGNLDITIPSMTVTDANAPEGVKSEGLWVSNLKINLKDRPIKGGYWEFSGSSSGSLESAEVRADGTSLISFNNITFSETGSIDDKKLYKDEFTMKGEGSFLHKRTKQTVKIDHFQMDGSIKNMHIDTYLDLMDNLYSGRPDSKKMELQALELLKHEPEINFSKIALSFNGHEGTASLKLSVAPMTEEEKNNMPLYLAFLQKFRVEAAMDIPEAWVSILFPRDVDELNAVLSMGEQEGYIVRKDGRIKSDCKYEMGNLTVNGKPIKGMGGMPF